MLVIGKWLVSTNARGLQQLCHHRAERSTPKVPPPETIQHCSSSNAKVCHQRLIQRFKTPFSAILLRLEEAVQSAHLIASSLGLSTTSSSWQVMPRVTEFWSTLKPVPTPLEVSRRHLWTQRKTAWGLENHIKIILTTVGWFYQTCKSFEPPVSRLETQTGSAPAFQDDWRASQNGKHLMGRNEAQSSGLVEMMHKPNIQVSPTIFWELDLWHYHDIGWHDEKETFLCSRSVESPPHGCRSHWILASLRWVGWIGVSQWWLYLIYHHNPKTPLLWHFSCYHEQWMFVGYDWQNLKKWQS